MILIFYGIFALILFTVTYADFRKLGSVDIEMTLILVLLCIGWPIAILFFIGCAIHDYFKGE